MKELLFKFILLLLLYSCTHDDNIEAQENIVDPIEQRMLYEYKIYSTTSFHTYGFIFIEVLGEYYIINGMNSVLNDNFFQRHFSDYNIVKDMLPINREYLDLNMDFDTFMNLFLTKKYDSQNKNYYYVPKIQEENSPKLFENSRNEELASIILAAVIGNNMVAIGGYADKKIHLFLLKDIPAWLEN